MHRFVCLFPIQIDAAARYATKGAKPTEGRPGCVLRGPACNYLPCGRRTCKVFLGWGTKTPFLFDVMLLPSQEGMPWNVPRQLREAQAMLLGDGRAAIYLPCGRKDSPRYFRPGDQGAIFFFGVMHILSVFCPVQNIAKMDTRAPGWLGWMPHMSRHLIVFDCWERTNKQTGAI